MELVLWFVLIDVVRFVVVTVRFCCLCLLLMLVVVVVMFLFVCAVVVGLVVCFRRCSR